MSLALIAALTGWLARYWAARADAPTLLKRWLTWTGRPWLAQGARLLYAVGLPTLVLLWRGALTARGLGLQPLMWLDPTAPPEPARANLLDWARDLGWAWLLCTATALILCAGQRAAQRAAQQTLSTRRDGAIALREACYHQAHWAFYREPFVLLWGPVAGAFGGLLPITLEAALNPARWADLRAAGAGRDLLIRAALAVLSAMLYVLTQNFWLTLWVDFGLSWALGYTAET